VEDLVLSEELEIHILSVQVITDTYLF